MIHVHNLSYTYPGAQTRVLNDLSFDIAEAEIFGFLGPSGAGKSTTQKILYKILRDFEGDVQLAGKKLQDWNQDFFEKIGVGFELPNHYLKLTGKENLNLFASFYPQGSCKNLGELFEQVGLEDSMNMRVESYSKGMKMRLNFIRAIMHDPEILFFDEPTAGLDPVNARKIKQLILGLKAAGKTIFITTHNMTTADEICDRVGFIVEGHIKIIDKPLDLKHRYGKNLIRVELENQEVQEFPIDGAGKNQDFLNFIQQEEILRMNTLEASLEDVFIEVTGQHLHL